MTEFRAGSVYQPRSADDGARVLVDRLWPRGLSKAAADLDIWVKDIAPSTELRKWIHANPDSFEEFTARYRDELDEVPEALAALRDAGDVVTLLSARHDAEHVRVLLALLG